MQISPYQIEMFGGLCLRCGEQVVTRFPTYKTGSLLARLAYYSSRSHTRQELIELLWPDVDSTSGRMSLRQALTALRRYLEPSGVEAGSILIADRHEVRLAPGSISTDVAQFESLLQSAAGKQDARDKMALLHQAIALYRGELLHGYSDPWILAERTRLAEAFLGAARQLMTAAQDSGDLEQAIEYALRMVAADPLQEESYADLMRLYWAAGKPTAALRQYHHLERVLKAELGEEPSTELQAFAKQLRSEAVARRGAQYAPAVISLEAPSSLQVETQISVSNLTPNQHPRSPLPSEPASDEGRGDRGEGEPDGNARCEAASGDVSERFTSSEQEITLPITTRLKPHLSIPAVVIGLLLLLLTWRLENSSPAASTGGSSRLAPQTDSSAVKAGIAVAHPRTLPRPSGSSGQAVRQDPSVTHRSATEANKKSVRLAENRSGTREEAGVGRRAATTHLISHSGERLSNAPPIGSAAPAAAAKDVTTTARLNSDELWVDRYEAKPGDKDSEPTDMVADDAGSIYVTGFIRTARTDVDYLTLKYAPTGKVMWEHRYNGPSNDVDRARSIALDSKGCVYVTGDSDSGSGSGPERLNGLDLATIKYSPNGKELWVRRYDGPGHGMDRSIKVAVDGQDRIYVLGYTWGGDPKAGGTGYDITLIQYDSNGSQRWVRTYNSPGNGDDTARALLIDKSGAIYVLGQDPVSCVLLKYDATGRLLWERHYSMPGDYTFTPVCMAADSTGTLYIAGYAQDMAANMELPRRDYQLLKYSASGDLLWYRCLLTSIVRQAADSNSHADGSLPVDSTKRAAIECSSPTSMALDSKGRIYVTGDSFLNRSAGTGNPEANRGYIKTEVFSPGGSDMYSCIYAGAERGENNAECIVIDRHDNIYVTGRGTFDDPDTKAGLSARWGTEYVTLSYDIQWRLSHVRRYSGPNIRANWARAAVLDRRNNVIVTGQSLGSSTNDIVTIKYRP